MDKYFVIIIEANARAMRSFDQLEDLVGPFDSEEAADKFAEGWRPGDKDGWRPGDKRKRYDKYIVAARSPDA